MEEILEARNVMGLLEVGRTYRVPCLYSDKLGWVPVIPFIHQDPELNNPRHHVHYDYRFMDEELKEKLLIVEGKSSIPVLNTRSTQDYNLREMVCVHPTEEVDPCFLIRKGILFVNKLDDACENLTFKGKVCPHKGYSLEGVEPNSQGIITCPLHGSRWNKDGSYAGTNIIPEILLARYLKENEPAKKIKVRLFSNEVDAGLNVKLSDLEEIDNYDPVRLQNVSFRMKPRPRVISEVKDITFKIHGAANAYGYYYSVKGWDAPIWMERFRQGCEPRPFTTPRQGDTITITLLQN